MVHASTVSDDGLMTVKEVQEELKLSRNTVYALVRSGELESYRLRGQYRISTTQLFNYLSHRSHPPAPMRIDDDMDPRSQEPVFSDELEMMNEGAEDVFVGPDDD